MDKSRPSRGRPPRALRAGTPCTGRPGAARRPGAWATRGARPSPRGAGLMAPVRPSPRTKWTSLVPADPHASPAETTGGSTSSRTSLRTRPGSCPRSCCTSAPPARAASPAPILRLALWSQPFNPPAQGQKKHSRETRRVNSSGGGASFAGPLDHTSRAAHARGLRGAARRRRVRWRRIVLDEGHVMGATCDSARAQMCTSPPLLPAVLTGHVSSLPPY